MSVSRPRSSLPTVVAALAVWGAALFAVLQVQHLSIGQAHYVCGPWGCGPPPSALLACHGFWLVLLSLPAYVATRLLTPSLLRTGGLLLLFAGVVGAAGITAWEYAHWYRSVDELKQSYFKERVLFSLGTRIDLPVVETALYGLIVLVIGWRRREEEGVAGDALQADAADTE